MPTVSKYATSATQGPQSGTTNNWSTPTNATGSGGGSFSSWTSTASGATNVLELGFGFTDTDIPVGATVTAVTIDVKHYRSNTSMLAPQTQAYDGSTSIGSTITLGASTSSSYSQTGLTLGGTLPTAGQLRSSGFVMRFTGRKASNTTSSITYIDWMQVNVTYDLPVITKAATLTVENWATQTAFNFSALASASGTNLLLAPSSTTYAAANSNLQYDLVGSSVAVLLRNPPNIGNGSVGAALQVKMNDLNTIELRWENNNLTVSRQVAGTWTGHGVIRYDDYKHRWFRIREASGTIYFETGPDGVNYPNAIYSQANPFALTAVTITLQAGTWNAEPTPGAATFGTLNPVVGAAGPNQAVEAWSTVTLTGTGTSTWAQTDGPTVGLTVSGTTATFVAPPSITTQNLSFIYAGSTTDITVKRARHRVLGAGGQQPVRLSVGRLATAADAVIRSSNTAAVANSSTTKTVAKPPGVVPGDLLVLFAATNWGTAASFAAPPGFTVLFNQSKGTNLGKLMAAYKVATSTEPDAYTVTVDASGELRADIYAVQNWNGNTAQIRHAVATTAASTTTHSAPSVTPATATGRLFSAAAQDSGSASTFTWTPPTGMTEHYDARSPSNTVSEASASATYNSASATGVRTWTLANQASSAAALAGNVVVPSITASGVTWGTPLSTYVPPVTVPATVRSSTTATYSSSGTTGENVVIPSDAVIGDLCVAYISADTGTAADLNPPAGFTEIAEIVSSAGPRTNISYRVVVSGDPGRTVALANNSGGTVHYPAGSDGVGICVCVKDWSGDTAGIAITTGSPTRTGTSPNFSVVAPSANPVTEHGLILSSAALDDDSAAQTWTWTPPSGMTSVASMRNGGGWMSGTVASETWAASTATGTRTWGVNTASGGSTSNVSTIVIPSTTSGGGGGGGTGPTGGDYTGGSGGDKVDATGLTHDNGVKTSKYHLFAGGLDWTKNVGLLVYGDGSGEYGYQAAQITNQSPYLLYGATGLIAVAKKHNMVLLAPMAPGDGCTDNDGVCWYMNSFDGTTLAQKTAWSKSLIDYVMGRYNIDKQRVVLGGYSSGAQWAMQYYGPQHASTVMSDGLLLAISYGGEPQGTINYPTAFKQAVAAVWDVGALDPAYNSDGIWDAQSGYDWYTANGFTTTQLHVVQNEDHNRYDETTMVGQYGTIVDREITEHVKPA